MATSAEFTFINSVRAAEGVRQAAVAAAFTAQAVNGAIPAANLAAYLTALQAAQVAYITAVNAAATTAGAVGITAANQGPSAQVPVVTLNNTGSQGPIAGNIATFGSVA
jgi:hypothetical protein